MNNQNAKTKNEENRECALPGALLAPQSLDAPFVAPVLTPAAVEAPTTDGLGVTPRTADVSVQSTTSGRYSMGSF